MLDERTAQWPVGRKALTLLLTQADWTHRRAETVSLEAHGETRQRISWDFTVHPDLTIEASKGQMAVPLATLRKEPLKRLDVTDGAGEALCIWGRDENGELAVQALASGFEAALGRAPTEAEVGALHCIVHAGDVSEAEPCLALLSETLAQEAVSAQARESAEVLMAVAQDLAENFLLVVELPAEVAGTRTLVKMNYEGDLGEGESYTPFSTAHETRLAGAAWSSARSWHLELHAPPGLAVSRLTMNTLSTEDSSGTATKDAHAPAAGHTAHLAGTTTELGSLSWAELELRPARAGLVNQMLSAAVAGWVLLTAACVTSETLYAAVADPDRASAVAAVMLAAPAFLIALLSRGPEHMLVSRLLLTPRLLNLAVAVVLLLTAGTLVFGLHEAAFENVLRGLWVAQTALLIAAGAVRTRSVGGGP